MDVIDTVSKIYMLEDEEDDDLLLIKSTSILNSQGA